jgi:thioredoxin-dependent peroxiredoxin
VLPLKRASAGLLALLGLQPVHADELAPGNLAPKFTLADQESKTQSLSSYRGRWVVLYFYPKDDTPGCTTEACNFRDDQLALRALNVQILGISVDDSKSHAQFAQKFHLPFPLLADTEGRVARDYGALWSIGPLRIAKRYTFVIDPEGRIAKIYRNVKPSTHSRELQQDLKELQEAALATH